jgi:methionyl aminopeptidase
MNLNKKLEDKINIMQQGGKKLSTVLAQLKNMTKVGTNVLDLEVEAVNLIKKSGAKPAFKRVHNYNWATCININSGIVHGVPKNYKLQENDVISLDIGIYFRQYNTDMCLTWQVSNNKENKDLTVANFLQTGIKALEKAEAQALPGNRVGHISRAIQETVESSSYNVARSLTGHGVGKKLHDEPNIPCYLNKDVESTPLLKPGMTLAIEVIYMMGQSDLVLNEQDQWTIKTKDDKISAVFEETIAVTESRPLRLTKLPLLTG